MSGSSGQPGGRGPGLGERAAGREDACRRRRARSGPANTEQGCGLALSVRVRAASGWHPPGVTEPTHSGEAHGGALGTRLNWLRAAVLGAGDGIVSTAGLVVGVAGATDDRSALLTAGLAGLLAGSMSMAAGEYVSVSTQRDSEKAALAMERRELREQPEAELEELTELLTERDALKAHARVELGIDPDDLTNPWRAAWASFLSFTAGALLPLLAIVLPPPAWRLPVTVVSVLVALTATGWAGARLGSAPPG